jgi:alpha-ketoglutarate-dependent taurine dioxygenase
MNQALIDQVVARHSSHEAANDCIAAIKKILGSKEAEPVHVLNCRCPAAEIVQGLVASDLRFVQRGSGIYTVVQESHANGAELDYSSQSTFLDLHQDGIELADVPEFGLLVCEDPGVGEAPTIFSDSFAIIDAMAKLPEFLDVMAVLDRVFIDKTGREAVRPLMEQYRDTERFFLNFGSRIYLRPKDVTTAPSIRAVSAMLAKLLEVADASVFHTHFWSAGDVVLFDNRRTLHGRASSARDEKRRLVRFLVNR